MNLEGIQIVMLSNYPSEVPLYRHWCEMFGGKLLAVQSIDELRRRLDSNPHAIGIIDRMLVNAPRSLPAQAELHPFELQAVAQYSPRVTLLTAFNRGQEPIQYIEGLFPLVLRRDDGLETNLTLISQHANKFSLRGNEKTA